MTVETKVALDFIMRVLRCVDPTECEGILWRTDGEFASVTFFVNCNDLFYWATADAEDVTPNNVGDLESAYRDTKAALPLYGPVWANALFACRQRKMRPQACAYPEHQELWPLFDACGPARDDDKTTRPSEE